MYCSQHVPKTGPGKFDTESVGIKLAMNAPRPAPQVNEQIRPGGKATFDADAMAIRAQISAQSNRKESQGSNGGILHDGQGASNGGGAGGDSSHPNSRQWGRYDSSALHIQHALKATEVQRKYSRPIEKPIDEYLVSWEIRQEIYFYSGIMLSCSFNFRSKVP